MSKTPREVFVERIGKLDLPQAKDYASFLNRGDDGGPLPCWGAVFERFDKVFKTAKERKAVLDVLIDVGDRRPLILFIHFNLDRPAVMKRVLERADRLPLFLQRAVVSIEEMADLVEEHLDRLAPAARQIFEAGPEVKRREREMFDSHVARLLSFRYHVPDEFDPAEEDQRFGPTAGVGAVRRPGRR